MLRKSFEKLVWSAASRSLRGRARLPNGLRIFAKDPAHGAMVGFGYARARAEPWSSGRRFPVVLTRQPYGSGRKIISALVRPRERLGQCMALQIVPIIERESLGEELSLIGELALLKNTSA
jgi:hypothetical protein